MSDSNSSTRRAQARTLATAVAWGEEWGKQEIEMVAAFPEETAEELARALGRTVYAVQSVRERLAQGLVDATGARRRREPEPFRFTFAKGWRD